jgi:uncharacterized protein
MSGADLKRTIIPGTLTLAYDIGDEVLQARADKRDPIAAALNVTGGHPIFEGKLTNVARRLVGGFARGVVAVEGTGSSEGRTITIDFQNENLIARESNGDVIAIVPDLICIVDQDTAAPITTEVLRYGMRVTVLGIPAPMQLRTPRALATIGPAAFGYPDVDPIPLAGRFGNGRYF